LDQHRRLLGSVALVVLRRFIAATGVYLLLSLILFRRALFSAHSAIGIRSDPYLFQWHLAWVAHALSHGTNPLFSTYIAAPGGENLMYASSVPLAGVMLWPVTSLGGTLLSYNILVVVCIVASAAAAYAMCTRFVSWKPAALIGGALYGFSPYMAAQSAGHPHVTMAWFPPIVVIVADSIARGKRSPVLLGLMFGTAVAAQLLLGIEVLITSILLTAVGTLGWAGLLRNDEGTANARRRTVPTIAVAAATVGVLGSFPLYMLLFGGQRSGVHAALQPADVYVNDLAGFVVPGRAQLIATAATRTYTGRFPGNYAEATAYIGLPLVAVIAFYLWRRWPDRTVRLPVIAAAGCAVASLGSHVHVDGVERAARLPLPGAIFSHIPVLWNILPARLMLYAYLAIALAVASIIDRGRPERRNIRVLAVGVSLAFLLPASVPAFSEISTPSAFRSIARSGGSVLVTPTSNPTSYQELVWQANTGFSVRLVGGYILSPRRNTLLDALSAREGSGQWSRPSTLAASSLRRSALQLGTTVIFDVPDRQDEARRAFLTAVFGPAQTSSDGFATWHVTRLGQPTVAVGAGRPM
jgi:hypothetical protein